MTSPSQPLNIKVSSPRGGQADLESYSVSFAPSVGTPDLRAIRAQFSGIPPNIPARGSVTPSLHPASSTVSLRALPERSTPRSTPQLISGVSATRETIGTSSGTPFIADLDDLPAEEKAKVLERHLVSKDERMKAFTEGNNSFKDDSVMARIPGPDPPLTISRRSSNGLSQRQEEDQEPFPILYDAPGADVT
jgi:solute carrier family 36 (proton-coupled amino acid transporter)